MPDYSHLRGMYIDPGLLELLFLLEDGPIEPRPHTETDDAFWQAVTKEGITAADLTLHSTERKPGALWQLWLDATRRHS